MNRGSLNIIKIVLTLAMLFFLGCKEQIVHNLEENEANQLLARLHTAHLQADKVLQPDARWAISVASSDSAAVLQFLSSQRILKDGRSAPVEQTSLLVSREEQRFRYERKLSLELENTLHSLQGVLDARVHLNISPIDPLFPAAKGQHSQESASVLLVVDSGTALDGQQIAALISGASGIPIEKVSVLFNTLNVPAPIRVENPALSAASAGMSSTSRMDYFNSFEGQCLGIVGTLLVLGITSIYILRRKRQLSALLFFNPEQEQV